MAAKYRLTVVLFPVLPGSLNFFAEPINDRLTGSPAGFNHLKLFGFLFLPSLDRLECLFASFRRSIHRIDLYIADDPHIIVDLRIAGELSVTGDIRIAENLCIPEYTCLTMNLCIPEYPCVFVDLRPAIDLRIFVDMSLAVNLRLI